MAQEKPGQTPVLDIRMPQQRREIFITMSIDKLPCSMADKIRVTSLMYNSGHE
jgi:hypothetical protein